MSVILTDDNTNCDHVLKEDTSCNLGEERNDCFIFMALHTSYHCVNSVHAGHSRGWEIFVRDLKWILEMLAVRIGLTAVYHDLEDTDRWRKKVQEYSVLYVLSTYSIKRPILSFSLSLLSPKPICSYWSQTLLKCLTDIQFPLNRMHFPKTAASCGR